MTTEEYITAHKADKPAALALKGAPEGVDLAWALRQIEGIQTAQRKLPRWAAISDIHYPIRLSMQQCSGQDTAEYKAKVAKRLAKTAGTSRMIDLTGGLGVDFSFMAPVFDEAIYVERDKDLCELATHNFPLLGLQNAKIQNAEGLEPLPQSSLIYIDPARRDTAGNKIVRIEDCQPNVAAMQDKLLQAAPVVMVKLSPMLDISLALKTLHCVAEVHVVEAAGECKELLFVLMRGYETEPEIHCMGLQFTREQEQAAMPHYAERPEQYIYEPSPALMKAAPFHLLSSIYDIRQLHPDSHLYTSNTIIKAFPGRTFCLLGICDAKTLHRRYPEINKANIIVRGYPETADTLRRRLKIKDGGEFYIIGTTISTGKRVLLLCKRNIIA